MNSSLLSEICKIYSKIYALLFIKKKSSFSQKLILLSIHILAAIRLPSSLSSFRWRKMWCSVARRWQGRKFRVDCTHLPLMDSRDLFSVGSAQTRTVPKNHRMDPQLTVNVIHRALSLLPSRTFMFARERVIWCKYGSILRCASL